MALTIDSLLAKLQTAGVAFSQHAHPAVMTIEAQAQELASLPGAPVKNLFLKDKKNRFYIITALPSTNVDLKVLSSRLGLGKGGVRMADEEQLLEVLKVPLGSVTPLAVANPSAAAVALLLDDKIRSQEKVYVHPLVNTVSLGMEPGALDAALRAVGREPVYVDLEADPKIDRENPPDLAKYAPEAPEKPAAAPEAAPGAPAAAAAAAGPGPGQQPAAAGPRPQAQPAAAPAGGAAKGSKKEAGKGGKAAAPSAAATHMKTCDVHAQTQDLLDKVAQALLNTHLQDVQVSDPYVLTRLRADVESQLNALKNAAFTLGYTAGKGELVSCASRFA